MDEMAVQRIAELAVDAEIQEVNGETYAARSFQKIYHDPRPDPLAINSLTGLVDYLNSGFETRDVFALISSPNRIDVFTAPYGESNSRDRVATVTPELPVIELLGGTYVELERFKIALRSQFQQGTGEVQLLDFLSKVDVEKGVTTGDDGVSQKVTTRNGVSGAVKGTETAPARIPLRPYRTFLELEQPKSEFIFRLRTDRYEGVEAMILEADGGAWKLNAREAIKAFFANELPGLKVIA